MPKLLEIKGLEVSVEGKKVLRGINLTIRQGEVHALMGPNASGKSTLSFALMGHPRYSIDKGKIILDGEDITNAPPDERARKGMFLSFQYPSEVPGVTLSNFLRTALNAKLGGKGPVPVLEFKKILEEKLELLKMDKNFASRYLNQGFSGGEKKRSEILQMAVLQPEFAILDETDSGLDIDALRIVAKGINSLIGPNLGVLLITHYLRILHYVTPDFVHVMINGRIVSSGTKELAEKLEKEGYSWLTEKEGEQE